jgi:hypothetical protein
MKRPLKRKAQAVEELESSEEVERVQKCEDALAEVHQRLHDLKNEGKDVSRLSTYLERFRDLSRRLTLQQVPGFTWTHVLRVEPVQEILESLTGHRNGKIAARAQDTLQTVRTWSEQEKAPMVLQAQLGRNRVAGQEGYESVVLSKSVISSLRGLFDANDRVGVETVALLYGLTQSSTGAWLVTDLVQPEQTCDVLSCDLTKSGCAQWSEFHGRVAPKQVVGWAHSHRQLRLVPEGRAPSEKDIETQYSLQRNYPQCRLMVILNEEGWSAYPLPSASMHMLTAVDGHVATIAAQRCPQARHR